MRLIDADRLLREDIRHLYYHLPNGDVAIPIKDIENAPTVIDIVHCKECKYATMTMDGECKYCDVWFPDEKLYLSGDYFCGDGERRNAINGKTI